MQQKSTAASVLLLPSGGRGMLLCVLGQDSKQHQFTAAPSICPLRAGIGGHVCAEGLLSARTDAEPLSAAEWLKVASHASLHQR